MGRAKKQLERKKKKKDQLAAQTKSGSATVARNRKASFDFHLGKEIIAGIMLKGPEVKSLRLGNLQLKGAYAKFIDEELWLFNCHISPYEFANRNNTDPDRPKKLLLNRYELDRIQLELQRSNKTLIASKVLFKSNKAKVILNLAEGKNKGDKRDSIKRRQQDREIRRDLKDF